MDRLPNGDEPQSYQVVQTVFVFRRNNRRKITRAAFFSPFFQLPFHCALQTAAPRRRDDLRQFKVGDVALVLKSVGNQASKTLKRLFPKGRDRASD